MGVVDFPTWFGAGSDGGLVFGLLAAAGIAAYALRLRRGTRRQLARAMLVLLISTCLMFAPIWWAQTRFDMLGPTLQPAEVAFWLGWTALFGWTVPLGIALGFAVLAAPQPLTGAVPVPAHLRGVGRTQAHSHPSVLDDPGRLVEPLGTGRAWGHLVPVDGPFAQRPVPLTRQVTLLGREADCDIVVPDEQASRHHAEVYWDHGRVQLVDRGSLNGTRVNGQGVLGQVPLREGDIVEIGSLRYRFEQAAAVPSPIDASPASESASDVEETRKVPGVPKAQTTIPMPPSVLALVAVSGPRPGARWELRGALTTIGRDAGCEVSLPDSSVSRRHAQVVRQVSGLYVQDLDSQNGTLLNGQPLLAPAALRPGDLLRVGEVMLRCELAYISDGASVAGASPDRSVSGRPTLAADVGELVSGAEPNTHTLLTPTPHPVERTPLAPPRLLPSKSPDTQS